MTARELLVVDIGGGSTEFVVGRDGEVEFHVSTQAGVVRQTERHIHDDPPPPAGIAALAAEMRAIIGAHVPRALRAASRTASPSPAPPPRARRSSSSSSPTTETGSTATCSPARSASASSPAWPP